MGKRDYTCQFGCPVEAALDVIGGKWKGVIVFHLLRGTKRFGELRRILTSITQRMLTLQLRELEADGVIERKIYAEVPPRVEYSLTPFGQSLGPLIQMMYAWGNANVEQIQQNRAKAQLEEVAELA